MPDYNQNRNSFNALRTQTGSYLQHASIPNLSLTGASPFSIEIHLYYQKSLAYTVLYGQVGVFEMGVANGSIFLSAPGFCNFNSVEQQINLVPDSFNYIALVYDGDKLSLFLQGYKVATYSKTGTGQTATTPWVIGKGTMGYMCCLRVFSEALSDAQIRADHINSLVQAPTCVFWLSWNVRQPIDKGKYSLPLSVIGSGAKIVNLVPCSSFGGYGCATFKSKLPDALTQFTVMGKIYPDFSSYSEMCIYYSKDTEESGYELFLRKLENFNYQLVFATKGLELVSTAEVVADRWMDFAVTYNGTRLNMFVDGQEAGTIAAQGLKLKGSPSPLIGAHIKNEIISYKRAYGGYIDYLAEFGACLSAERITGYIDNPPFIFDKDLLSVVSLNNPEPSELAYEDPVFGLGDFHFTLAEDTCMLDAAKGVQYYYPTEKDPVWDTLNSDDQSKLEYYCSYVDGLIQSALGVASEVETEKERVDGPGLYMTGTTQLMRRRVLLSDDVPYEKLPTEVNMTENASTILRRRHLPHSTAKSAAGNGYQLLSTGGATAVAGGATAVAGAVGGVAGSSVAVGIGIGIGVVLAVGGVVALLVYLCSERPESEKSGLSVLSLAINENGDASRGSIHCRQNATTPVPEVFVKTNHKIDVKGVLIPASLTHLTLKVEVKNVGQKIITGNLIGTEIGNVVFSNVSSGAFTLNVGETRTLSMPINVTTLVWKTTPHIRKLSAGWRWTFQEQFVINTTHVIHTILALPRAPWITAHPYVATDINYVWTDLLDVCADAYTTYGASGAIHDDNSHLTAYAKNLYSGNHFTYDRTNGATFYCDTSNNFKLQKYLSDNKKRNQKLNCTDCAHIVTIAGVATGIQCCIGKIRNSVFVGIPLNQIIGIGSTQWGAPFDNGSTSFSYHDIAFAQGTVLDKNSLLFDACLQIDSGGYPGKPSSSAVVKTPLIPTSYTYSENDLSDPINVPVTQVYNGHFYRQRLVIDGGTCLNLAGRGIPGISIVVTKTADLYRMPMSHDPYIESLKEKFNLMENPIPYYSINRFEEKELQTIPPRKVGEWELMEDLGREKEWQVSFEGKIYLVTTFEACNSEEAFEVLLLLLANITHPDIERLERNDLSFILNDTLVLCAKEHSVFKVTGVNCLSFAEKIIGL